MIKMMVGTVVSGTGGYVCDSYGDHDSNGLRPSCILCLAEEFSLLISIRHKDSLIIYFLTYHFTYLSIYLAIHPSSCSYQLHWLLDLSN